jgi:hypothetical protein
MEQNFHSELNDELNHIDIDSIKLDAAIQLRTWQKHMYALIDKTYKSRLHEIDSIAEDINNGIKEKQKQLKTINIHDEKIYLQLKNDINSLKSNIQIEQSVPASLEQRIERTVRVSRKEADSDAEFVDDEDEEDDDDEPVLIDIDQHEAQIREQAALAAEPAERSPVKHEEGRVSKIFYSEPVQRSIAIGVAKTIAQMGAVAATSTTTIAATTMAKTAIIATACAVGTVTYGVGKVAIGATQKVWSWAFSSDD